jgi:hypothetical protein
MYRYTMQVGMVKAYQKRYGLAIGRCSHNTESSLCLQKYGRCPGGEGAVLKTVGLRGLAGSNPVPSARVGPPALRVVVTLATHGN